jgi:hypothetical protein
MESSKGCFDIFLESLGELMMRQGDTLDGLVDPCPRALEDAVEVMSDQTDDSDIRKCTMTYPSSDCGPGVLSCASFLNPMTYCSSIRRRSYAQRVSTTEEAEGYSIGVLHRT